MWIKINYCFMYDLNIKYFKSIKWRGSNIDLTFLSAILNECWNLKFVQLSWNFNILQLTSRPFLNIFTIQIRLSNCLETETQSWKHCTVVNSVLLNASFVKRQWHQLIIPSIQITRKFTLRFIANIVDSIIKKKHSKLLFAPFLFDHVHSP